MSYKAILIDQLNACYHDKSWFIPLHDILTDLNAAEASYVKNEESIPFGRSSIILFSGMRSGLRDILPNRSTGRIQ